MGLIHQRHDRAQSVVCPADECGQRIPVEDLLFLCPSPHCSGRHAPLRGKPGRWANWTLFQPERYDYSVACPYSPHRAYLKVCPHCWTQLPVATGQTETIAIVGSSISGKTCFVTGLIRKIERELSRETSFGMALEWDDQDGLDYFKRRDREIYRDRILPDASQKKTKVETLQITVRFPIGGWRRLWRGPQGVVSLVFPDPAGEFFEKIDDTYYLDYLAKSRAIVLMVAPWMSDAYRSWRSAFGRPLPPVDAPGADRSLNSFIQAVRRETQRRGKLPQHLAVVLTKCDEEGLFDPDDLAVDLPEDVEPAVPEGAPRKERFEPDFAVERFRDQGRPYDVGLTREISRRVQEHMERDLGLSNVVALANEGFRRVGFFAASALGTAPVRDEADGPSRLKLVDPSPRRVEEPLLWILHRWGYW